MGTEQSTLKPSGPGRRTAACASQTPRGASRRRENAAAACGVELESVGKPGDEATGRDRLTADVSYIFIPLSTAPQALGGLRPLR
jgi:hypothetical protein